MSMQSVRCSTYCSRDDVPAAIFSCVNVQTLPVLAQTVAACLRAFINKHLEPVMQNESNILAFAANGKGIGLLFAPALMHGQLPRIEWQEEKDRLLKMLAAVLLGFACLLCLVLLTGALLLTLSWETSYRMPVMMALITACVLGTGIACRRFQDLSTAGTQSFASACAEQATDAGRARRSAGAGVVHGET